LRLGHGVIGRGAIRKNAGQLRYFGKPPAVIFALALDLEVHGNVYFTPVFSRCLTFDMSGGPKGAMRPLERPLDGRVRRRVKFGANALLYKFLLKNPIQ
jgi:hypothetical protein